MTMISDSAMLSELAAEFPGYEFSTQRTWEGVSLIAVRQKGSARSGLYVVITPDFDEMRRTLLDSTGLDSTRLEDENPDGSRRAAGRGYADRVEIVVDDLTGPQIASFLDEHVREMLSITPPESKHALDLDMLREPGITFWSVMDGGTVVGCGALKRLDARQAEVKSMRTLAARQRSGIASMMLEHIIAEARRMGFTRLSLETGSAEFFAPARRLYQKFGFEYCEPFADYRPDPLSVFLTRTL
jgi:putative acetyltransferase